MRSLWKRIGSMIIRGATAPCDGVHGTWRLGWDASPDEPVHDLTDAACEHRRAADHRDERVRASPR